MIDLLTCREFKLEITNIQMIFVYKGDILDINEIFKDLATMVNEQDDMIGE